VSEQGILAGLTVVEGSALVAAPLGGMTLAQLGADVIRFDQLGGGRDYGRWRSPTTTKACSGRDSTRASARSKSIFTRHAGARWWRHASPLPALS
jgi:crotonobetainyl-CoA:carnitine CoA-transferase CaiB-like acyl-CoA transferase